MNYSRLLLTFLILSPMTSFTADKKKSPTASEKAFATINAAGVSTFAQPYLIKNGLNDKNLNSWWTTINTAFNDAIREDAISKNDKNTIPDAKTYFAILNNVDIFIKNTVKKLNTTHGPLYVKEGDTYVPHFKNSAITPSDIQELNKLNLEANNHKKDAVTIIDRMESYSKTKSDSVQRTVLSTYALFMESVLKQIIRETNTLLAQAKVEAGTYPKVIPTQLELEKEFVQNCYNQMIDKKDDYKPLTLEQETRLEALKNNLLAQEVLATSRLLRELLSLQQLEGQTAKQFGLAAKDAGDPVYNKLTNKELKNVIRTQQTKLKDELKK